MRNHIWRAMIQHQISPETALSEIILDDEVWKNVMTNEKKNQLKMGDLIDTTAGTQLQGEDNAHMTAELAKRLCRLNLEEKMELNLFKIGRYFVVLSQDKKSESWHMYDGYDLRNQVKKFMLVNPGYKTYLGDDDQENGNRGRKKKKKEALPGAGIG